MKIAFDHQTFCYQPYGGISRYFSILAKELIQNGHTTKIFAGLHRNNYLSNFNNDNVFGYNLKNYPPKSSPFFQWLNHGISQIPIKNWKPDIIHETYYSAKPILKSNTPRIATIHDMIHELYPKKFNLFDYTTKWKKETFKRVDHIISVSQNTKKDLINIFSIDEDKISVVSHGIDTTLFQNKYIDRISFTKPIVLYVGNRGGYKNFNGFLKSFASSVRLMKDFDIVTFGGGSFTNFEKSYLKKLGFLENQVHQMSGDDNLLASLYHSSDALIYPSIYEGFGLPTLEAMAAGCPVISSNSSSMPEVVRDAGQYFNPNDIDEMREALECVLYSDTLKEKLIKLGLKNICNFSWNKCANETLDIYKSLI